MNNSTINQQPNFTARTIINTNNNHLSKAEINTLTKMGEKIGLPSDTIKFSLMQNDGNNKLLTVSHHAKFNDGRHSLEAHQSKNVLIEKFNPFEYIKSKMDSLKKMYEQTFS